MRRVGGIALLIALSCSWVVAEDRLWKDAAGKYSVEAEFKGMSSGIVTLLKKDGKTIKIPLERLSKADKEHIKNRSRPSSKTPSGTKSSKLTWAVLTASTSNFAPSGPKSLDITLGDTPAFLSVELAFNRAPTADQMRQFTVTGFGLKQPGKLYSFKPGVNSTLVFKGAWTNLESLQISGLGHSSSLLLGRSSMAGPSLFDMICRGSTLEVIEKMIADGADINGTASELPLHEALRKGDQKVIELLLSKGADVNASRLNTENAIAAAAAVGKHQYFDLLISNGAKLTDTGRPEISLLYYAAKSGNIETVQFLLDQGFDIDGRTETSSERNHVGNPLSSAASSGGLEMVEFLLKKGADPNFYRYPRSDETLLHSCAKHNSSIKDDKIVEALLKAGLDIDVKETIRQRTALHYFGEVSPFVKPTRLKMFLAYKPNLEAKDTYGYTALHVATRQEPNSKLSYANQQLFRANQQEVIQLLLEAGANPNAIDSAGKTVVESANYRFKDILEKAAEEYVPKPTSGDATNPQPGDVAEPAELLNTGKQQFKQGKGKKKKALGARRKAFATLTRLIEAHPQSPQAEEAVEIMEDALERYPRVKNAPTVRKAIAKWRSGQDRA